MQGQCAEHDVFMTENMKAKVLYLYQHLYSLDSADCSGSVRYPSFLKTIKECWHVTERYAISEQSSNDSLARQTITAKEFIGNEYDVLVIEGRLGAVRTINTSEKISSHILREYSDNGGIVIFLFADVNSIINGKESRLSFYNRFLSDAGLPSFYQVQIDDFVDALITRHVNGSPSEFQRYMSEDEIGRRRLIKHQIEERDKYTALAKRLNFSSESPYFLCDDKYRQPSSTYRAETFSVDIRGMLDNHTVHNNYSCVFNDVKKISLSQPVQLDYQTHADAYVNVLLSANSTARYWTKDGTILQAPEIPVVAAAIGHKNGGVGITITGDILNESLVISTESDAPRFVLNVIDHFLGLQVKRSYHLSLSNEIAQIQETKFDETLSKIGHAVITKTGPLQKSLLEGRLRAQYGETWDLFEQPTKDDIYCSEYLLAEAESRFGHLVIGSLARAVEAELREKLFKKIRASIKEDGNLTSLFVEWADSEEKKANKQRTDVDPSFCRFVNGRPHITIGAMKDVLHQVVLAKNNIGLFNKLHGYLRTKCTEPRDWSIGTLKAVVGHLEELRVLRNTSVHGSAKRHVTLDDVKKCRTIVLGDPTRKDILKSGILIWALRAL